MNTFERFSTVVGDRRAALAAGRRLARAAHLRRCRLLSGDRDLIGDLVRTRPRALEVEVAFDAEVALPSVLLRGLARAIHVRVHCGSGTRVPSVVELAFVADNGANHPESRFEIITGERLVDDCLLLAATVGALAIDLDAALARYAGAPELPIRIPIYADAFPLLVTELVAFWPAAVVHLHAEVAPAHAEELVVTMEEGRSRIFALAIARGDDRAFDRIANHPSGGVVVWDHPDHAVSIRRDGRVCGFELALAAPYRLELEVMLDQTSIDEATAWLGHHAGVPITHRP